MSNITTINRKYETLFYPKVKKTIDAKFDDIISMVQSNGIQSAINSLSNDLTNPELAAAIQQLHSTVGLRYANDTWKSLKVAERSIPKPIKAITDLMEMKAGASFGFNATWVQWILNYLRRHLIRKITFDVNATTKEHLLLVLNKSINEGLGIDETVRLLEVDEFTSTQAARIVRTEINMASNAGTLAAGETYEWQMQKKWIAVHDNRTRGIDPKDHASHIGLDGTVIDFEDVFIDPRNGDRLKSPGDPMASAASLVNCRCQMSLKPKRDLNGRLIPKRRSTVVIYPNQTRRVPTVVI